MAIAERTYTLRADGKDTLVHVKWDRPEEDDGSWFCPLSIQIGDGKPKVMRIGGVDSVQALELALKAAAAYLYSHDPHIFWLDEDDDLGLPVNAVFDDVRAAREQRRAKRDGST